MTYINFLNCYFYTSNYTCMRLVINVTSRFFSSVLTAFYMHQDFLAVFDIYFAF